MDKTIKKYAVLEISGKQYRVSEGDEILIEGYKSGEIAIETLLVADGEKVEIGKPTLDKVKIGYKIIGEEKGEKIEIIKYKSKSRYRRHTGFRPQYTRVLINKIS
jgi:large subunit ribosomal protein L21